MYIILFLVCLFFSLMPYWLVCIIHVENNIATPLVVIYLSEDHHHHHNIFLDTPEVIEAFMEGDNSNTVLTYTFVYTYRYINICVCIYVYTCMQIFIH
jgi:hypothetical protein